MPYRDAEIKALEKVSNKYLLTVLVCKRVKQLQRGAKPLIDEEGRDVFDTALREIATGKIVLVESSTHTPPGLTEEVTAQPDAVAQTAPADSIERNALPGEAGA